MSDASHNSAAPVTTRRPVRVGSPGRRRAYRAGARGFTLIEVLAAILLIAIVLPIVMQGVSMATRAGSSAKRRTEATALAQMQLNELLASGDWQQGVLSGDFSPDYPDYHWAATLSDWTEGSQAGADTTTSGIERLDLTVFRNAGNQDEPVATLSTLVYVSESSTATSGTTGSTGSTGGTTGGGR